MIRKIVKTSAIAGVSLFALTAAVPAGLMEGASGASLAQEAAAKPKQKTRKVPAMTLPVHKRIQKAQEAMDLQEWSFAETELDELLARGKINDYEKAVIWQLKASIAFEREDTPATITAYETILSLRESIPVALESQIKFGLGQLYYSVEDYERSLQIITEWEKDATVISATQLVFIAQLYYIREDYRTALTYVNRAIADAEAVDTIEPKESWYQLALSSHWEMNEFASVRDVLEILIIRFPKPIYWQQLAGVYGELGDEQKSFSITEAAYKQGFLDENPAQIVNVAQILMARQAPIKAAWVMEKALKNDQIELDEDNARLLGQSYLVASEYAKALGPLTKAAGLANDGTLWMQVGQVAIQLDQHGKAAEAFANAVEAFDDEKQTDTIRSRKVTALTQLGSAQIELKEFDKARAVFRTASRIAKSGREQSTIKSYRSYLSSEEAREQLLRGDA